MSNYYFRFHSSEKYINCLKYFKKEQSCSAEWTLLAHDLAHGAKGEQDFNYIALVVPVISFEENFNFILFYQGCLPFNF